MLYTNDVWLIIASMVGFDRSGQTPDDPGELVGAPGDYSQQAGEHLLHHFASATGQPIAEAKLRSRR